MVTVRATLCLQAWIPTYLGTLGVRDLGSVGLLSALPWLVRPLPSCSGRKSYMGLCRCCSCTEDATDVSFSYSKTSAPLRIVSLGNVGHILPATSVPCTYLAERDAVHSQLERLLKTVTLRRRLRRRRRGPAPWRTGSRCRGTGRGCVLGACCIW